MNERVTKKKMVSVLLLFVMGLYIFSCSTEKDKPVKEIIRPVKYIKVFTLKEDMARSFSGLSKAGKLSRMSFRVGGKIETIKIKEGDRVQKDTWIASLDDSDAMLEYEKTLSSVNKSKVYRDTAKSNLDRIKSLYENNNVSLNEYEAAKEKYANFNATYLADKRTADLQKKELGYYTLYSSMSGVISELSVETGENISGGQVILKIHSMDEMEVSAGIPDAYIAGIKKGATVNVEFTPIKNKIFEGRITEVSYNVDQESSTYPVTVRILYPSKEIRPGMPANITFDFSDESAEDSLLVPVHAVGEDQKGNFIYIVKMVENGIGFVEKKQVTTGKMTSNGFEILNGVKDGERVVTAGISHLSDGLKVRVQE